MRGTPRRRRPAAAPVRPDGPDGPATPAPLRAPVFVALDFETANSSRDSACALAVVRVEGDAIVERRVWLIRTPTPDFVFTGIHGIRWSDVRDAPTFGEIWPEAARLAAGADFLAAHNASFDRSVLNACCRTAGIEPPATPFECTMTMARRAFGIYPTRLPDVCRHLGISLRHHEALSDAEACARIVIAARAGTGFTSSLPRERGSEERGRDAAEVRK